MNLDTLTIAEAADQIRRRSLSPVELVEASLERIGELNPELNAFITLCAETALDEAQDAEAEIRRGEYRGPLHGIPVALKDLYNTAGVRTTSGSSFFRDFLPEEDAAAVSRLKAAGAVLLGKLNMHEIALGVTSNNAHFGPCRNPWDLERTPGGSSGGSGAALAAGMCLGSLGSDTGGSIRIPASLCGIVGLKPTYGRVSLRGVTSLSWNLDHAGPMGRSVEDVAILLEAIAGYDPADPASADIPVESWRKEMRSGVKGWRIAKAVGEFFESVDPQVAEAVDAAARRFEDLGAQVEEIDLPMARAAAQANGLMVVTDAAVFHRDRLSQNPEGFGSDVLQRLRNGAGTRVDDYVLARRVQVEARRSFEELFRDYHVLLTPTTPIPAPLIEGEDAVEQARRLTRFTSPFNLTGLPALSVPCGLTEEGLPVGLQIISGPWREGDALRAGYAFEMALGKWFRPPILQAGRE